MAATEQGRDRSCGHHSIIFFLVDNSTFNCFTCRKPDSRVFIEMVYDVGAKKLLYVIM